MTREDTARLFDLLALYRPGDRHLEDKQVRALWALTLAPYAPEDVKQAVAAFFRESKYWPDVTDIAIRCPKPDTAPAKVDDMPFDRQEWEQYKPTRDRWLDLVKQRRENGLPGTLREAEEAGISEPDWTDMLEKAGLAWGT